VKAPLCALLALLMAAGALGAVRATLDANQVGAGEPVRLVLQYEGQTREQPDLAPLQQDFDILSTSRSNNMQIINGTVSSHTETQIIIAPKRAGQILLPPITWAGEASNPLTLNVSAKGTAQPDSVFLETIVDQKQPYVCTRASNCCRRRWSLPEMATYSPSKLDPIATGPWRKTAASTMSSSVITYCFRKRAVI
jgi:hypothetical protein